MSESSENATSSPALYREQKTSSPTKPKPLDLILGFWGLSSTAGFIFRYLSLILEDPNVTATLAMITGLATASTKLGLELKPSESKINNTLKDGLDLYGVFTTAGAFATYSVFAGLNRYAAESLGFGLAIILALIKYADKNEKCTNINLSAANSGINVISQLATAGFVFGLIQFISKNPETEPQAAGSGLSVGVLCMLLQTGIEIFNKNRNTDTNQQLYDLTPSSSLLA